MTWRDQVLAELDAAINAQPTPSKTAAVAAASAREALDVVARNLALISTEVERQKTHAAKQAAAAKAEALALEKKRQARRDLAARAQEARAARRDAR